VPDSFKFWIKDLQSLCLDVKVLDKDNNEIVLKDDDDDDYSPTFSSVERSEYHQDDREMEKNGFAIEQVKEDDLSLDFGGDSKFEDDDYTEDLPERKGDTDE